jgi:arylsulfatase A-like enzyme
MARLLEGLEGYLVVGFFAGLGLGFLEFTSIDLFRYLLMGDLFMILVFLSYIALCILIYVTYGVMIRKFAKRAGFWNEKTVLKETVKVNVVVVLVSILWRSGMLGLKVQRFLAGDQSLSFIEMRSYLVNGFLGDPVDFVVVCLLNCIVLPCLATFMIRLTSDSRLKKAGKMLVITPLIAFFVIFMVAYYGFDTGVNDEGYNVVLIVVDTLRADHLGVYGYDRNTSPNVEKLAEEGIVFHRAYAPVPKTTQSMSSIMTAFYPHKNGVRSMVHTLDLNQKTLAEILREDGYTTSAFIRNAWIDRYSGLQQGFDYVDDLNRRMDELIVLQILYGIGILKPRSDEAGGCTDNAITWLHKNKDRKFFMWLHYMDPHRPYNPPEPYDSSFDSGFEGEFTVNDNRVYKLLRFNTTLSENQVPHALALYDGEILYNDRQIGRFLSTLEELDLYDKTMIIYTSDHGEAFGEHRAFFGHGAYLYDEEVRVPLIIKLPDSVDYGLVVEKPVNLVDVTPTILEVAGITFNSGGLDGVSLVNMTQSLEDRGLVFAESAARSHDLERKYYSGVKGMWRMVVSWPWKLVLIPHPDGDIIELYNLVEDPSERKDVSRIQVDITNQLESRLRDWMSEDPEAGDSETRDVEITPDREAVLRDLGYLA